MYSKKQMVETTHFVIISNSKIMLITRIVILIYASFICDTMYMWRGHPTHITIGMGHDI